MAKANQGFLDLAQAAKRAIRALKQSQPRRALSVASDLHAVVRDRIISTGTTSTGSSLRPYSTRQTPKYRYLGRGRNASVDAKIRRLKSKTLSYKEFRNLNGLQTGHVDLFFTGGMWRGTGVAVKRKALKGLVTVEIKGQTTESREKLTWNNIRYKTNVLEPSTVEIEFARKTYAFITASVITEAFLSVK